MNTMAHQREVTPAADATTCDVVQLVDEGDSTVSQLARPSKWSKATLVAIGAAALAVLVAATLWATGAFGASSHNVVVTITGEAGTVYRIEGGPDGDTGPVSLGASPAQRQFSTDVSTSELALLVTVTPPNGKSAGCSIVVDGTALAVSHRSDDSASWTCRTRK
jgi:hypothetical protein